MKNTIAILSILFLFSCFACEEIENTEEDFLPKLNFLLLDKDDGDNLLATDNPVYDFENITFSTVPLPGTDTPSEIFPITLKEDPTYGPYISVDIFGEVLWEEYLTTNTTTFTEEYNLNLATDDVNTVTINLRKVAPSLRMYVTFNGENAENDTIPFNFVFMKEAPEPVGEF